MMHNDENLGYHISIVPEIYKNSKVSPLVNTRVLSITKPMICIHLPPIEQYHYLEQEGHHTSHQKLLQKHE